jgi:hypothetical protein
MNYTSINGLRMLLVEGTLLLVAFVAAFLMMRFIRPLPARPRWIDWLLATNSRAVFAVIVFALLGRALLLPIVRIPEPRINDEFSYLLAADTFSHHRLANPTPPSWQHFETFHVNLVPTYHSKYPVGQGLVLAFGEAVFHQPWIGVYLSTAVLCGAICWALQAFVPPGWALLGAMLAVVRLGLLSYWINSYWGGSVAALGGALALGAVVRLFDPERSGRSRVILASSFALGLLILATSRPYEGLAFSIPLIGYFGYRVVKGHVCMPLLQETVLPVALIGAIGLLAMGYYNRVTTGDALLMPYVLNYRTYWPLPAFLGQKEDSRVKLDDPVFIKFFEVTKKDYEYQRSRTISDLLRLEGHRVGIDWFFYVGPALSFPFFVGFVSCIMQPRLRIVVWVSLATAIALALSTYSAPHYAAPATIAVCVFVVEGMRYFWEQRHLGERAFVVAVCLTVVAVSLARQTGSSTWNATFNFKNQRKLIAEQLESKAGQHLVLVTYDLERHYPGNELVHNGADFSSERILWARSKGNESDLTLCRFYPDRTFWSVTTDDVNLSLKPLDLCKHP